MSDYETPIHRDVMSDRRGPMRKLIEDLQWENARLRAALATVLGTRTHGMNMTWEERIRIGRAALDGQPEPGKKG